MAKQTLPGAKAPTDATQPAAQRPTLFQPFEWTPGAAGDHAVQQLAGRTRDVSMGVSTALSMIERDMIDAYAREENGEPLPRLLGGFHTGALLRLCITSLDMLEEQAARCSERAQARH